MLYLCCDNQATWYQARNAPLSLWTCLNGGRMKQEAAPKRRGVVHRCGKASGEKKPDHLPEGLAHLQTSLLFLKRSMRTSGSTLQQGIPSLFPETPGSFITSCRRGREKRGRVSIERAVGRLEAGDVFRDWLAGVLWDRLPEPDDEARVYRIEPASHVVCRYEFIDAGISVIGKFFGAPTGAKTRYDANAAMMNEFHLLRSIARWVRVPGALATNSRFHAVLVTEYVPGRTLRELLAAGESLYEPLTGVAHLLRRLHESTQTSCDRERDFAYFHALLDQNGLPAPGRERFGRLLGAWRHSPRICPDAGCVVHGDATPGNYLFDGGTCAVDFEGSRDHAHPIRDLGILASEIKASPGSARAEDYIGHLLWHYSNGEEEFRRNTAQLPFFMALGYLRIARLPWRAAERDWLLGEAEACLAAGPG